MRDSACAGAVKSSWVMLGNSRKTIWVGVASVIGMVLAVAVDHPGARLAWRDRQPRFPLGLHLAAPVAGCAPPNDAAAASSEERRVGEEWVRTGRSRWAESH